LQYINAYLNEISRRLPRKNRDDIIEEIRSILMDMIETHNPGADPDEATIKAVLNEFGPPKKVAQQYVSYKPLIGPDLFSIYLLVLKVVLTVITILNFAGVIVGLVNGAFRETGLFTVVVDQFFSLCGSLINVFGIVTLIFVLFERFVPEKFKREISDEWSPDDLNLVEDKMRVSIPELVIEIIFEIIFIVFFNFYLDKIGIYSQSEAGWVMMPIFNENILRYIPWLTAIIVLNTGINLYLIRQGIWNRAAGMAKIVINVLKIAVFAAIILGPPLLIIGPESWPTLSHELGITDQQFTQYMNLGLNIILGLAIFGFSVDTVKHLWRNFIKKDRTSMEIATQ